MWLDRILLAVPWHSLKRDFLHHILSVLTSHSACVCMLFNFVNQEPNLRNIWGCSQQAMNAVGKEAKCIKQNQSDIEDSSVCDTNTICQFREIQLLMECSWYHYMYSSCRSITISGIQKSRSINSMVVHRKRWHRYLALS